MSPLRALNVRRRVGRPGGRATGASVDDSVEAQQLRMEPRARIGKNRGQQNFADQELQHFLYAHGDVPNSVENTKKVLDELLTDFITEMCFEAHRSAQLAGRQKIKPDDIKFACRKNPQYLGKIEETMAKKAVIEEARKALDPNDDKIMKSHAGKAVEESLDNLDNNELDSYAKKGRL